MPLLPRAPLLVTAAAVAAHAAAGCAVCEPDDDTALDYGDDAAWVCRPGAAGDACAEDLDAVEVLVDGGVARAPHTPAEDPEAACFWIYPTVDLSLTSGVHDDFGDPTTQRNTVKAQAARLTEACSVHAPLYRQVTLGVYGNTDDEVRGKCFAVAIDDVLRAFDAFLADVGDERPLVIGGHSQGGQMTTEIVRRRVEQDDALLSRLVAALPIGWPVGVAAGERSGGTFSRVPVCAARDEVGCAVSFRSFGAGNELARSPSDNKLAGLFLGDEVVCTNPVDDGAPLGRSYFTDSLLVDLPDAAKDDGAPFALYRDAYTARCVRDGDNAGLEVTPAGPLPPPVDLSKAILSGDSGTHLLDMQFAQGAVIELVAAKIGAR